MLFLLRSLYLLFFITSIIFCQSTIHIRIFDDNINPQRSVNINVSNVTFCSQGHLNLQLYWINQSNSLSNLFNKLETESNSTNVYLAYTTHFYTKLIRDYAKTNQIPFINMKSIEDDSILCSLTKSFLREYFLLPNILEVLINYIKYNHIKKIVYIYNNNESTHRIYDFLQLLNTDDYFNSFSFDIRSTHNEDIYSLLYHIESYSFSKDQLSRLILLDLHSFEDYEDMFERISHMGLTGDSYQYIILSTFDVCLWMNKLNFTGQLIYFDYQQRECLVNQSNSSKILNKVSSTRISKSYYRSTLSFRHTFDFPTFSNSTKSSFENSSLLSNHTKITINSCHHQLSKNVEYFSYENFHSQLSNISDLYSYSLYKTLNLLIHIFTSNLVHCKTYRLKTFKNKSNTCHFTDINIYSIRTLSLNPPKKQIELIGRYSPMTSHYQTCQIEKAKQTFSSKIYYITSIFDEPFLMLRKRTKLYEEYSQSQVDLKELQGQIFDFDQVEGFCVDLAEEVCSILNITCRFRIVEDGGFGSKNSSTGVWNGMVGEIVSRKADMAIAPLTISQKRMEVVDFSKPFMNLGISIMIRKPDKQKPGVFSFMNPVSMEIWLCLSLAYVAVSTVLFLTSRIVNSGWRRRIVRRPSYRSFSYPKSVNDRRKSEIHLQRQKRDSIISNQSLDIPPLARTSTRRRYHYRTRPLNQNPSTNSNKIEDPKKKNKESAVHLFGISNALFFTFSSFMRQSINLVPKSLSGRIAATSWWCFSLVFLSSYTANLVAFLTVERLVTPIESVEDLANQQEIKYGSLRNGTTSAFFEKSNVSMFQAMWVTMQRSSSEVFVSTNDEGVAKVRNSKGKYAFFIESTKNEYVNQRLPCDTMKVGSDLDSKGYGIATRIGSDLTEAINIIITNLRESGFLEKLKQRWWYERSECSQTSKDQRFSELSLSSVTGLFYIFLFGIIVSCISAFTEFVIIAKNESDKLNINIREILRIKMIENMIGITIQAQKQLEYAQIDNACNYHYDEEEDEIIKQYTEYQLNKTQSDV